MVDLTETKSVPQNGTAAAMGLFDGLHKGHRAVISRAAEIAAQNGLSPAVFTFDTESVTSKGDGGVKYILSREIKLRLISGLGAEYVYSPVFAEVKDMNGEDFVRIVLRDRLKAEYAVCGEDFRFGRGARWGTAELEKLCGEFGIKLFVVPDVKEKNGRRVSSTMIRELIGSGEIQAANELLGSCFGFELPVSEGKKLGRTLDFPTINQIIPHGQVLPKFGVYTSETEVCGRIYKSITNVGVKPTVGCTAPLAETYITNFDGDLYGKTVRVSLIKFVRPEMKFGSIDELKKRISLDIESIEK